MTIIHQDLWWGKLVPSPYKRSELSNRVFCSFSSRKESICKWIPISNSLGKEAALVNVSISKGGLKCQRVVISDMPNWGDKVIRRYTHGGEPTSHHVILMIGSTCYFWKSCAIRVRFYLIFPLILVIFAWNLKQIPRKNYWNMPI